MTRNHEKAVIELRLDTPASLFDPYDPFPIPSRDLAPGAEDFIVGWARELPENVTPCLRLHAAAQLSGPDAAGLKTAIAAHFMARAERTRRDLHELFLVGRRSLAIGIVVLAICILASSMMAGAFEDETLGRIFGEGLIILGWVANWRPLEIFLYDWWPIVRRQRLFERLAHAEVEIANAA